MASFHSCGISPVWNDRLKRNENDGASSLAASLSKRFGIESNPGLCWYQLHGGVFRPQLGKSRFLEGD